MPSCDATQLIGKVCSQRRERRPASVATNWRTEAGLGADWHVANRARCPHHAALENSGTTKLQPIHRIREKVLCSTETQVHPTRHARTAGCDHAQHVRFLVEMWSLGWIHSSVRCTIGSVGCGQGERQDRITRAVEILRPKRSTTCKPHRGDRQPSIEEPCSEHMRQRTKTKATKKKRKH